MICGWIFICRSVMRHISNLEYLHCYFLVSCLTTLRMVLRLRNILCHRIYNCFPPRLSIQKKKAFVCASFYIFVNIFKIIPVIFFKFCFSVFTNTFLCKCIFILVTAMLIFSNEERISLLLNRRFWFVDLQK